MSYNDQDNHHLLIWLNQERQVIGESRRFYSFDQLMHSCLFSSFLSKINPLFFADLTGSNFEYKAYLLQIEKYLNEIEDLRFKRNYRQALYEKEYISELVKLVLFLIMRQEVKQEFVARILTMQEETQIFLMKEIKRVGESLENKMEIKDVCEKIEELEDENEALHQKITQAEIKNEQIRRVMQALKRENVKVEAQHRANLMQKTLVMEQLGLNHPKEYLQIYKDLELEQLSLTQSHHDLEATTLHLHQENQEMSEKIVEDAFIIEHLDQKIAKYKSIYSQLKKNNTISLSQFAEEEKENMVERERLMSHTQATRACRSIERQMINDSHYSNSLTIFEEEEGEGKSLAYYNNSLNAKLQQMYCKIDLLNSEISALKGKNQRVCSLNLQKQREIGMAWREFQSFCLNYQFTISG